MGRAIRSCPLHLAAHDVLAGINSSIFMLLFGLTCWSLNWMYTTEVRRVKTLT